MFVRRISLKFLVLGSLLAVRPAGAAEDGAAAVARRLTPYAAATWRSLTAMVQPSGLPADGLQRAPDGTWTVTPYTSPTNVAAYLWSILSAEALGLIGPDEADLRIHLTLTTLERMERSHGFFYNWYDPVTTSPLSAWPGNGAPLRPFLSSVDNGWLAAALMMVGAAKPEFSGPAQALLRPMDFGFFYDAYDPADPVAHPGLVRVGFWTDTGTYHPAHYGMLNTEARIISYIGITRGQIPREHYYRLQRTLPSERSWQQQRPAGEVQEILGVPVFQGHYTYRGLGVVPSWGGSMFEALMVALFVPEAGWAPASWGVNHPLYVRAQIEFGRQAGHGYWGYSPASRPEGGYQEYGVPDLGTVPGGYPAGDVVTPHASFLALPFAPQEALENLTALAGRFPIYGPFGFSDSVNVRTGQVAGSVLALDQGMILAAIANTLGDRFLQRLFCSGRVEEVIQPLIALEHFTAGDGPSGGHPQTRTLAVARLPDPAQAATQAR
jgi:Putative glucoamylase/Protein of unknown function (DUF3131)